MDWMDPRPIGTRSVLHFAGADDGGDVLHDENDAADGDRSGATENDGVDAASVRYFSVHVLQWIGPLHFYEQRGGNFAAIVFEPERSSSYE